jgi:type VI protein secretion system component VasK
LKPLRACLNPFQPVARLAVSDKDGNLSELKPYGELVAELIKQLEAAPAKVVEDGSKVELKDALPPAGRVALAVMEGQPDNLRQRFLRFLQERQIPESLQGPLLVPLRHVVSLGENELRGTLARAFEQGPRHQLQALFDLYPFRRSATMDATPADLDPLKPQQGALWQSFTPIFGPVVVRQNGRWRARTLPGGTPPLPPELLPLINRAEEISRRLFTADGKSQKLRLSAAALPPQGLPAGAATVRTFLISGKSVRSVFVPSGVAVPQELAIDWTQSGVAAVGVELQVGGGAPQTQSLDGPESPWSLFRLIERAKLDGKVATWRLPDGAEGGELAVAFSFGVDPFSLFQIPRGGEAEQ